MEESVPTIKSGLLSSLGLFSNARPPSILKLGECTPPFASSAASDDKTDVNMAAEDELAASLAATSAATVAAEVSPWLFSEGSEGRVLTVASIEGIGTLGIDICSSLSLFLAT